MSETIKLSDENIKQLEKLSIRYEKLTKKTWLNNIGENASKLIPKKIKELGNNISTSVSEKELFQKCMNIIGEGFKVLEEQASKSTLNEKEILNKIKELTNIELGSIEEICEIESEEISKMVNKYKTTNIFYATVEGAGTGTFGFAGIPFNIVLSMFLYFRAVQSIAMCYGYDIKNDAGEMVIAGEVFSEALNPSSAIDNENISLVGKIMVMSQLTVLRESMTKSYSQMAAKGGVSLLFVQIRALANKAAQKGLEKAGKQGLENTIFKECFEAIGRKLSKEVTKKAIPGIGAVIGAFMDASQMNKITEYADIFYHKRFIIEQEERIEKIKNKAKIIEV